MTNFLIILVIKYFIRSDFLTPKLFISKFLIFFTLVSTVGFSVELNVINENPSANIFINGKYTGSGTVYKSVVTKGEHHVKATINDETIYSEIINVEENTTKTINTTRIIDSTSSNVFDIASRNFIKARDSVSSLLVRVKKGLLE